MSNRKSKTTIGPVEFIHRVIKHDEKGEPFALAAYQRRVLEMALRRDPSGELVFRLVVLSEPKKSGKTFTTACLALWWAVTNPHTEIIIIANDLEQSVSRVFKTMTALIEQNEALGQEADVLSSSIRVDNGTLILPIASDYKGAASSRHSLVCTTRFGASRARRRALHSCTETSGCRRSRALSILGYGTKTSTPRYARRQPAHCLLELTLA